ncbi:MAG: hypoxanthine phosphoribosyltransferase [Oscillospiraceae bacterium]|jgi:hypoxanthine phosphoribosyltransferase|nr:hypoxanthine phosphoribosyltransferase [Oscillospiraceae bacterium]
MREKTTAHATDLLKVSYDEGVIKTRVEQLGQQLAADYADKNPVFVGILNGAFVFLSDLARACDFPLELRFLRASSYGSAAVTSGNVKLESGLAEPLTGRHVLIVEDILDSGVTLSRIRELLLAENPASLRLCAFLDKTECRLVPIEADYVGFTCEPSFFVGYGLDYAERYRNLPYIGVLKPEIYGGA